MDESTRENIGGILALAGFGVTIFAIFEGLPRVKAKRRPRLVRVPTEAEEFRRFREYKKGLRAQQIKKWAEAEQYPLLYRRYSE